MACCVYPCRARSPGRRFTLLLPAGGYRRKHSKAAGSSHNAGRLRGSSTSPKRLRARADRAWSWAFGGLVSLLQAKCNQQAALRLTRSTVASDRRGVPAVRWVHRRGLQVAALVRGPPSPVRLPGHAARRRTGEAADHRRLGGGGTLADVLTIGGLRILSLSTAGFDPGALKGLQVDMVLAAPGGEPGVTDRLVQTLAPVKTVIALSGTTSTSHSTSRPSTGAA
jgi:hypothetical protein